MIKIVFSILIGIILNTVDIECHGFLIDPPARSSAWREDPRFPKYFSDNQMFCGGFDTQWRKNKGRCGICGENWSGTRLFEKGGKYYTGLKVRTYKENEEIQITANHEGFIEYRICNVDNIKGGEATQKCLNKMLLRDKYGRARFRVLPNFVGVITTKLALPKGFTCNHCVMQWRYHTANSWNRDRYSGRSCKGCGPQEEFYGCADVEILESGKSSKKYEREQSDSKSDSQEQTNDTDLLINLLNELIQLKNEKDKEENSEKQKVQDSDEGLTAFVDIPQVNQKTKTISYLDQHFASEQFAKRDSLTLDGNMEIFEESNIKTADPVAEDTNALLDSRLVDEKANSIVFPDEPRPSEEFFNRGIVNFDESSQEILDRRDEEHVGVPLQNRGEEEISTNKKIKKDMFYNALKKIFRNKMAEMN